MAAKVKYATIEEAAVACGIELTEQSRPFLQAFVKKAEGAPSEGSNNKKKELLENAKVFGVTGIEEDKENSTTLQIKILTFLFEEGRTEEMNEFAQKHNLHVTEEGHIHRVRAAVKPIEERNAGVKEGTIGYNTIQLLKNLDFADLTAAELADKLMEVYGQKTTAPSVQWYVNYCTKKDIEIAPRKRAAKGKVAGEAGLVLGAELTMEKATAPKGFAKKAAPAAAADLGENIA